MRLLNTPYPDPIIIPMPPTPAIRQLGSSLAAALGNAEYCNENMVVRRGFPPYVVQATPATGDHRILEILAMYNHTAGDGLLAFCVLHHRSDEKHTMSS